MYKLIKKTALSERLINSYDDISLARHHAYNQCYQDPDIYADYIITDEHGIECCLRVVPKSCYDVENEIECSQKVVEMLQVYLSLSDQDVRAILERALKQLNEEHD